MHETQYTSDTLILFGFHSPSVDVLCHVTRNGAGTQHVYVQPECTAPCLVLQQSTSALGEWNF